MQSVSDRDGDCAGCSKYKIAAMLGDAFDTEQSTKYKRCEIQCTSGVGRGA